MIHEYQSESLPTKKAYVLTRGTDVGKAGSFLTLSGEAFSGPAKNGQRN